MNRCLRRLLDLACGRPLARPLAWGSLARIRRWAPVAAPLVARTYLSLPFHLFFSPNERPTTRRRPLSDAVQQAGLDVPLAVELAVRLGERGLATGVRGENRPILWPNLRAPTPLLLSLMVGKECTNGVSR